MKLQSSSSPKTLDLLVAYDYLHFDEPYLLRQPSVSRRMIPDVEEQQIAVPESGTARTVYLSANASSFITSVAMSERVTFVNVDLAVQVNPSLSFSALEIAFCMDLT